MTRSLLCPLRVHPRVSQVNTTLQAFTMLPIQSLKGNEIAGLDLAGVPVNDFHASMLSAFVGTQSSLLVQLSRVCSSNREAVPVLYQAWHRVLVLSRPCRMLFAYALFGPAGFESLEMWGGYPWDVGVGPSVGSPLVLCGDCVFGRQSYRMGWHRGAHSCDSRASILEDRALGAAVANKGRSR
jgi:hypothetical protein